MTTNFGARYFTKLQEVSKLQRVDMLALIKVYVQQRLLYRLSVSDCGADFCLKGGLMIAAYNGGELLRPTDDIDLNGFGLGGIEDIERAIRIAVSADVPDDGVSFNTDSIKVQKDRGEGIIPGGKLVIEAAFHSAKVLIKVDVGFGNVITPWASEIEIPTLLADHLPCPRISAYPLETIIAEKLHAMAQHGYDNTRLKDYYDIWKIQKNYEFDGETLSQAISATFEQQQRPINPSMPGLSDLFARKSERDWKAFLRKTVLKDDVQFADVILEVRDFTVPAMLGAAEGRTPDRWYPDGGWQGLSMEYRPQ
ncbi:nucleotidyl transferase AbiEii/AbiGii toxin family protein [Agrobacterium rubi]|nr:nucleotidyl transferase AbiEii/AbiGii toxin family protein [Agrobacterium rubi]NTF24472.1 nucleotidyl transferase AbiEii/AbiGii toxin family protein [Agrobacterium rubi]